MLKKFVSLFKGEAYFKEKAIAGLITLTYILGNGIEMVIGKQTDDPALLWVTGIVLGIIVIVIAQSNLSRYTPPIFKAYLFYLNFNIVYAYAKSTSGPVDTESFYLLTCYLVFVVISQGIDSGRELVIYTVAEILLFIGAVYLNLDQEPILTQQMHQLMLIFVLTGNFIINVQRLKLTQVSVDSKIQFRSLSENSRDAQAILNEEFGFLYLNPSIAKLTGYPVADVMKMKLRDLTNPDDITIIKDALQFIKTNPEEKKSIEFRILTKTGQPVWVETILSTFRSTPDSKDRLIFTETRDITDRKKLEAEINQQMQAEELLIKHSNRFINIDRTEIQKNIDTALKEIASIINADGILVYRTLGTLADEFRCTNEFFKESKSVTRDRFNHVIKINQPLVYFLRNLKSEKLSRGTFVDTIELFNIKLLRQNISINNQFYLVPLPSGNIVNGFIVIVFDDNEVPNQPNFFSLIGNMVSNAFTRLRTESRLHEAQLTNEFILRALPDWLYIINESGIFTGINNHSTLNAYLPDYDIVGKHLSEILPDNLFPAFQSALNKIIETENPVSFEYFDNHFHKGTYLKATFAPFKTGEYLIIIRDVTDLKTAQNELELKAEKLERSNQELEQFAYVVSHDMKQPIRSIISFLGLLNKRHGINLSEEAQEYIRFSIESANKMDSLIKDILQYSRLDRQIEFVNEVDLNNTYKSVLRILSDTLTKNNVEVNCAELPHVLGNETMLGELFQNLIENGIKYNYSDHKKVNITVSEKDNDWLFSFKDNGIGFEPKHSEQIFKIFKRLHTDAEFQGTGIGLTICQKVVEKHGGTIWAESEKGKGSVFYFTLPKKLN